MKLSIYAVSLLSVISFNNLALANDPPSPPSIDLVMRYSNPLIPDGSTEIFSQKLDINPLSTVQRQAFERLSQGLRPQTELVLTIVPSTTVKEELAKKRFDAAIKEADVQIEKLKKELEQAKGDPEKLNQLQSAIAAEEQKRLNATSLKEVFMKGALIRKEAHQLAIDQHEALIKEIEVKTNRYNLELATAKVEKDVADSKKNKDVKLIEELQRKIAGLEHTISQEKKLQQMYQKTLDSLKSGKDAGLMHLRIAVENSEAAAKIFEKYSVGANRILAIHRVPATQVAKNLGKGLVPAAIIGAAGAAKVITEKMAENAPYKPAMKGPPPASSSGAQ